MQLFRVFRHIRFHAVVKPQHTAMLHLKPTQRKTITFSIGICFRATAQPCACIAAAVLLLIASLCPARTMIEQHQLRASISLHHIVPAACKHILKFFLIQLARDRQSVYAPTGNRHRPIECQLSNIVDHYAAETLRIFANPRMNMCQLVAVHDRRQDE